MKELIKLTIDLFIKNNAIPQKFFYFYVYEEKEFNNMILLI